MAHFSSENEDEILARIQEESLRYYNEVELPRIAAEARQDGQPSEPKNPEDPQPKSSKTDTSAIVSKGTPVKDLFYQSASQGAGGFHLDTGDTYIYPTNYPVRKYQRNIIQSALFHNTLVSLPTGLGKTFIAAVVMFNYYRWFPQGKVVFMAPTRPLVAQQIRACHDIMAIPIKDTVEMTGTMNPVERTQQWKSKRVFFLTPQVMANDLRSGICPAKSFKCVVIDEAHKATGEYAYCHVIKELENAGAVFRVLALSATPGSNIKAVIEVIQNMRITTLELRGEDSPDVLPYTHTKQVEPTILNLSKHIVEFREQYLLIFERYARSLRQARLITCNVQNISKFQLLKASERLRSRPPNQMHKSKVGQMMADFTVCMSLAHGLELLQTYGLRAFYHYFTGCEDEEKRKAAFTRLRQDIEFHQLMEVLSRAISAPMNVYWSHPKHETLVKILLEHFSQGGEKKSDSKVIIFCQFRVVVSEIHELLTNLHPEIKPVMFIGQGVGRDKNGLPQKKQIEIMKQFREGQTNVLIATCVAEEGLDIGSVDLLVLMEVQRSPVRLIQRLGRTGRHRKGRCVVLLTQGKEVQKFHEAMATRKAFLNTIQSSQALAGNLYRNEPVMFPPNLMPKMQMMHINVPQRITPGKSKKQSDIRQALVARLSDTEEAVEESPYLTEKQAALVHEELGSWELNYDALAFTNSEYLFDKIDGLAMTAEKLFSDEFCKQSEYNEWNRQLHQTYLLSHSSDTETLCHLLSKAEALQTGEHSDINSQVNYSQLLMKKKMPQKTKAKSNVETEAKKKKNDLGTRAGMDIRECMAAAAGKARYTQNLKTEETAKTEPIVLDTVIDLECSSDIPCPEHVAFEHVKDSDKESMHNYLDVQENLTCLLCNEMMRRISFSEKTKKLSTEEEEPLTLLELTAVGNFVESLTKDIVESINVGDISVGTIDFSLKTLKNSIVTMEESIKLMLSPNKELSSENSVSKRVHCTPPKYLLSSTNINRNSTAKYNNGKGTNFEDPPQDNALDVFDVGNIFEENPPPNNTAKYNNGKETNLEDPPQDNPLDVFDVGNIFEENPPPNSTAKYNNGKETNLEDPPGDNTLDVFDVGNIFEENPPPNNTSNYNNGKGTNFEDPPQDNALDVFDVGNIFEENPPPNSTAKYNNGKETNLEDPPQDNPLDVFDVGNIFEENPPPNSTAKYNNGKGTNFEDPPQDLDVFDFCNIFEENPPPLQTLTPNICTEKQDESKINTVKSELSPISQDFFGIEDIFNEDDSMFRNLDNNAKTSTPCAKVEKSTVSNHLQDDPFNSSSLRNKRASMCLSNKTELTRNIFKVPRLKLSFKNVETPVNASALKSPTYVSSPESPILSGQITQASRQNSPLKLERKALFLDDNINKQKASKMCDESILCNPLDKTDPFIDDNAKDDMNISISQLFDDNDNVSSSKNESENSVIMDQSSMYTITQMVNKVSVLNKNKSLLSNFTSKTSSSAIFNSSSITKDSGFHADVNKIKEAFESSDEDSIFRSINLDALEPIKNEVKALTTFQNNRSMNIIKEKDTILNVLEKSQYLQTETKQDTEINAKEIVNRTIQDWKTESLKTTTSQVEDSIRWESCTKSPLNVVNQLKTSTPNVHAEDVKVKSSFSDSDSNSSVFLSPFKSISFAREKSEKNKEKEKRQKGKAFIELEADVSGAPNSSDEENTSGLDELDASFINDMSQQVSTTLNKTTTDIHARYLQSVKSPIRKPGGFKIPTISDSVLGMDVFSQAVDVEDNDSYENDSFCCDDTEIPTVQDPSVLEIAEQMLKKNKRQRKTRKKRKVVLRSDSSSDEATNLSQEKHHKRLLTSESSCENGSASELVKRKRKRRQLLSSESSPEDKLVKKIKREAKKQPYLLTSESDSDITDIELNF